MNGTDVKDLSQKYVDAELHGDVDALDDLLTDDFRAVGPLGFIVDKQRWLDRYRSGELDNTAIRWDDVETRVHGDAAIVIGRWDQESRHQGNAVNGAFRCHADIRPRERTLAARGSAAQPYRPAPRCVMKLVLHLSDFGWPIEPARDAGHVERRRRTRRGRRVRRYRRRRPRVAAPDHGRPRAVRVSRRIRRSRSSPPGHVSIRLLTVVTGADFRAPGLLAKTMTTLDVLSGGRGLARHRRGPLPGGM